MMTENQHKQAWNWRMWPWSRTQDYRPINKRHASALILGADGHVDIHRVDGLTVKDGEGFRVAEPQGRYTLAKPIPAGTLWVYAGEDPEPITDRVPKGYTRKDLKMLVGEYLPWVVMRGRQAQPVLGTWMKVGLAIVAVLVVGGMVYYLWKTGALHG